VFELNKLYIQEHSFIYKRSEVSLNTKTMNDLISSSLHYI